MSAVATPSRARGVPIDNNCGLQALVLLVGIDVAQFGQRAQLLQKHRATSNSGHSDFHPAGCTEIAPGSAATNGEVLGRLHDRALRPAPPPVFGAAVPITWSALIFALVQRLQRNEHAALVR